MISFDTNILLDSLNPESKYHEPAVDFLEQTFAQERVIISDYVLVELYNLLRNATVMRQPLTAPNAAALVTSYLDFPNIVRAESAPIMDEVWKAASKEGFARRKIFDLRLGLTLRHHGATHFATANVKDFEGLGFDRVWNPLIAPTG